MFGNVIKLDLAELKAQISGDIANEVKEKILDNIHPIGSIYLTMNSENPHSIFGGTWKLIAQGKTLVGVDVNSENENLKTSGKEFGEAEHTLTTEEMPSHGHDFSGQLYWSSADGGYAAFRTGTKENNQGKGQLLTQKVGGGQPHNNYQPSFTCYIWQRVEDEVQVTTEEG
ncbi:MAG: hypothetical protein E7568_06375 [Ruminococcaceae bacterium]|nr:hypothetical protein [Oscillospiraceae bacterium]